MLAVDLDSTLIGRDHKVGAMDSVALQKLRATGVRVAICTGRNLVESAGVIGALELKGLGVFANGATIADMGKGRHVSCTFIDRPTARQLVDFFGSRNHAVLALVDDPATALPQYVCTQHAAPHVGTVEWLLANRMQALEGDVTAGPHADRIVRLSIVVDVPEARPIEEALVRDFGATIAHHSIYSKHYDCQIIEAFPAGVNKWSGIEEICRIEGLDSRRVITIGDDVNDIPMLENATLSFAVANAPPEIQQRAKRVTGSQENAGVAQVVEGILRGDF
jgi:Cof subfamily protein (haloacid dehalogenase superfamily)